MSMTPLWTDTHCHTQEQMVETGSDELLERARLAGVHRFIVEFDGPNHVESDMTKVVYHTYDQTLKEAKARAQAIFISSLIARA